MAKATRRTTTNRVSKSAASRVFLTFTGFHDPFAQGTVAGEELEGPILTAVRSRPFDIVVLLGTPALTERTAMTADALRDRHPDLKVDIRALQLDDPTDHHAILSAVRSEYAQLSKDLGRPEYFIGTASGTPAMHACWLLLAASGEIPARILHTRPARYVTKERPEVTEIDLTKPGFPVVRSQAWAQVVPAAEDGKDPRAVIERLGIVGEHPAIQNALQMAAQFAASSMPVLVLGESGTGKESLARLVHELSDRSQKPFVAVNCSAVQAQLAESTLFGHRKGAFTGADRDQKGKFEAANGGTLFLDEVGDLPQEVQAKLLRALQEGSIEPLGADKPATVNVRVIAATNLDLVKAIEEKKFRQDLFFRIAGAQVQLPPLRERHTDIPRLAIHFVDRYSASLKRRRALSPEALAALVHHRWPGNIRELENVVQTAVALASDGVIRPEHLQFVSFGDSSSTLSVPIPHEGFSMEDHLKQVRRGLIEKALQLTDGNQRQAAKLLGVSAAAISKALKGTDSDD